MPRPAFEILERRAVPKTIVDFCTLPLYKAVSLVRCGFELECQKFNGKEYSDYRYPHDLHRYNEEAYQQAVTESVRMLERTELTRYGTILTIFHRKLSASFWVRFIKHRYPRQFASLSPDAISYEALIQVFESRNTRISDLKEFIFRKADLGGVPTSAMNHYDWLISRMTNNQTYLTEGARNTLGTNEVSNPFLVNKEDYRITPENIFEDPNTFFKYYAKPGTWLRTVQAGSDNTVRGPEIRTMGGLTVPDFLQAVKRLTENDIEVDVCCSFHIHISLKGVNGQWINIPYSKELQEKFMEAFLNKYDDLSAPIVRRIQNIHKRVSFYDFTARTDRYAAIAQRGLTWEFRMFGNLNSYNEAAKCLMMAIKVFREGLSDHYLNKRKKLTTLVGIEWGVPNNKMRRIVEQTVDQNPARKVRSLQEILIDGVRPTTSVLKKSDAVSERLPPPPPPAPVPLRENELQALRREAEELGILAAQRNESRGTWTIGTAAPQNGISIFAGAAAPAIVTGHQMASDIPTHVYRYNPTADRIFPAGEEVPHGALTQTVAVNFEALEDGGYAIASIPTTELPHARMSTGSRTVLLDHDSPCYDMLDCPTDTGIE